MFQLSDFESICQELESPDVSTYEFFTESHGVKIYRLQNQQSGLYTYKVSGTLDGVDTATCAQVYMDLDYRKKWDGYAKDLRMVTAGDKKAIYWRVAYPFPMSHRDYVYCREMKELDIDGKHYYAVLAKSMTLEGVPTKSGVIRVTDYLQSCALTTDGKNGTKAFMKYYDDPGGMIPSWLINWAAKSGVPGFLKDMQKACRGYEEFKKKSKSSNSSDQAQQSSVLAAMQ